MGRIPLFPAPRILDHRGMVEVHVEQMLYLYRRRDPDTHRATQPQDRTRGPPTLPLLASQPWRTPTWPPFSKPGLPMHRVLYPNPVLGSARPQAKLLNPAEPLLSQEITKPQDCGNLLTCA